LDRKRNGKVKEYRWNGKIKFEGEYWYGKRNGKAKEFDFDGKLKFDDEYLDGNKIKRSQNNKLNMVK